MGESGTSAARATREVVMPFLVTTHNTKPGKEDLYEEFLCKRKLWFIRNLPGIIRYEVFRTERRAGTSGPVASTDLRYMVVAIIECEDVVEMYKLRSSDLYQNFIKEYVDLLEDDIALYEARALEPTGYTKDDFWALEKLSLPAK